jgi:SNF2 family DNA or RNA helicase
VLVVCPASLKTNWRNELNKWLVRPVKVAIQNAGQPWAGSVADIVVINYDILGKFTRQLMAETWDLLVADECTYAKNPQAQRTKLLVGAQRKADREKYPGIRAVRKVAATGTPILNKPVELFPILDYIAPGQWGFKDKIRYCKGYKGRWGWDFTGHAHEEEFQRRLRETVMVRRLKRDVLTELPAKRRQIIELDAGDAASLCAEEVDLYDGNSEEIEAASADKALAEAADDEEAYKNAVARLRSAQKVAFERISKVRHEVALAKVEQAVDHVMDVLESTPKLVVFAHHLDVIARIERELTERLQAEGSASNPVCVVTGQTPVGERQGIVDLFNGDPGKRVLILGIHAAGVGLSVKAAVEVFVELDWVPGIISQAEDRCHGIGRGVEGEPLLVQHLVLEGSLDSRMAKIVVAKQDIADRMLDKDMAKLATGEPVTALDIEFDADKIRREDAKAEDPELHDAVLRGLQMLAGVCDGAAMRDDMGFNGCDARIGHSLARLSRLSPKQAALGRRLLIKYRRQLPDDVNAKIRGKDTE